MSPAGPWTVVYLIQTDLATEERWTTITIFYSELLHVCAICWHQTEATFVADSETHRILNRSLNPVHDIGLCVRCWSDLVRD